mmetsp:Transcript_61427/g.146444  ORF Transcript_61427/g.146444 Transcript_61427/m.146444 type:complete len:96 (-) Transcript_61427:330-617(-)
MQHKPPVTKSTQFLCTNLFQGDKRPLFPGPMMLNASATVQPLRSRCQVSSLGLQDVRVGMKLPPVVTNHFDLGLPRAFQASSTSTGSLVKRGSAK